VVTCPRHGWTYHLETGSCLSHPTGLPLRFHDAREEGGAVLVSLAPRAAPVSWPLG
jgi:nitrite reductase/ring-hydroxylating ferredoxin subunit